MYKIGLLEDEQEQAERLLGFLDRYREAHPDFACTVQRYDRAMDLLDHYDRDCDLLFLDIRLPDMTGMEAAHRIREVDRRVMIIFVTSLIQYAIEGYSVQAFDYIVKPVRYQNFEMKMKKALARIRAEMDAIVVAKPGGMIRVRTGDIRFIEARGHSIIYHTDGEEIVGSSTSLASLEERLAPSGFLRCNKCYLVNYKHIQAVQGNTVTVYGGDELQISRLRKKQFMTELADWMGK